MTRKTKLQLPDDIPESCRHMIRVLNEEGYRVSGARADRVVGAIPMRRSKGRNPLIYIKKSEPFAGVTFLAKGAR